MLLIEMKRFHFNPRICNFLIHGAYHLKKSMTKVFSMTSIKQIGKNIYLLYQVKGRILELSKYNPVKHEKISLGPNNWREFVH